jgi:nitrogenase subunit NifH
MNLNKLEQLAKAATQGQWRAATDPCHYDSLSDVVCGNMHIAVGGRKSNIKEIEANTRYIAATNPETILRLIKLVREMGEAMQRDVDGQLEENIEVLDCVKAALAAYKEVTK